MRKVLSTFIVLVVVATSCSSSSGDDAAPDASPGASDEAATPTPTASTSTTDAAVTVWLPSSLELTEFVEFSLADADFDVDVIEEPAGYDETADAARAAIGDGHLVVVPAPIGFELVDDGHVLVGRIFEDADPDRAVKQLGVWFVAARGEADTPADTATDDEDEDALGSGVASVRLARMQTEPRADGYTSDEHREVSEYAGELEVEAGKALAKRATVRNVGQAVAGYGASAQSVVVRHGAKAAGPVVAVLIFLKTMHDFTVAATEAIEADSNARISLYDTGLAATAMISDAITKLAALEAPIISGEVSPDEAREVLDAARNSVNRASAVAVDSAFELEDAGEEGMAAQVKQLRQAQLDHFFEKSAELIDEIDRKVAAGTPTVISDGVDGALATLNVGPDAFGQFAQIFAPTETGNDAMHSNGRQEKPAKGETDIIGVGQAWWAPSPNGPGLDALLPCGAGPAGHVLCGGGPPADNYTLTVMELDGPLTFDAGRTYQYSFVFDRDGNVANNYIAGGSYPYDLWDNTDSRYEISIVGGQPALKVNEGPNFAPVDSGARIVIHDNTILALIPQDEIGGGPDDPMVPMRSTSFWHRGDFGEGPDQAYNLDVHPPVHDPLWLPGTVVSLVGPDAAGGAPGEQIDPTRQDAFDDVLRVLDGQLSFPSGDVVPDDPSPMADVEPCFANEYFYFNPTVVDVGRRAYEIDDTSVQVRVELHDSDDAAEGAFGFTGGTVSRTCRQALVESSGVAVSETVRTVDEDHLTADRAVLDGAGAGLVTTTFAGWDGPIFVRVTAVGPDNADVDETIEAVLAEALAP